MQYGIDNEVNALNEYSTRLNVIAGLSRLWINKNYLHLIASPDGLIFHKGKLINVTEVKCLNILRLHSVESIVNGDCPKAEVKRQCFDVVN